MTLEINWNPVTQLGPVPVNWYGLTFALGFVGGGWLVYRWSRLFGFPREKVEGLLLWIALGTIAGARLYFVVQNDLAQYLAEPWRLFALWEGGLAFFGGLFGAMFAAYLYLRRPGLSFSTAADLFAPAVPIGSAIGRVSCGLAGMDYGAHTFLPWGVVYLNPNSYAPNDGTPRHPTQFYELFGDLVIAGILWKMRSRFRGGSLFLSYLILFSGMRFLLFFLRGDVAPVALGLKNGQWTALVVLLVAIPLFVRNVVWRTREPIPPSRASQDRP